MKMLLWVTLIFFSFTGFAQTDDVEGLRKINGTNLFVKVKGKGDCLLVIHGGPGLNHTYFLPHLNTLEKKFKVIYFDQRACGKSSIPSADSISMKFLVEDIEGLRKAFALEKINILAHSWGAILAVQYGIQHPGSISKLIMSNPVMLSREYDQEAGILTQKKTTKQDSIDRAQILSRGTPDVNSYEKLFLLSFKPSAYNRDNVAKINLNLPNNFSTASTALFTSLMKDPAMNSNLYDSLSSLKFPVLIIHGQSDVIPPKAIERLKEKLPNGKLEIFKQSGHFPFVEEQSLYNEKVISFLK